MRQAPVPITPTGTANNAFRERVLLGKPGHHRIMSTIGVRELGEGVVQEALELVLRFPEADFRERFEPWGDRDFIVVHHRGLKVWGKIDCYNLEMDGASPNPVDDAVTVRVLTLMLPEEY